MSEDTVRSKEGGPTSAELVPVVPTNAPAEPCYPGLWILAGYMILLEAK